MEQSAYRGKARFFKSLSNEVRLRILDAIRDHPRCVNFIAEHVGFDQSTVSRRLGILRSAGIVEDRRDRNFILYSLEMPCVMQVVSCAANAMNSGKG